MPSPVKTTTHGDAPLTQSRETGDVNPESRQGDPIVNRDKASSFAKSWSHMVAGGYAHNTPRPLTSEETTLAGGSRTDAVFLSLALAA